MAKRVLRLILALPLAAPVLTIAPGTALADDQHRPTVSVLATGLENPRGLKFGPDRRLYVAEGGVGGTQTTVGQCEQVPPPVGPYTGSPTGSRISRINLRTGRRVTVADNLPSDQTAAAAGSHVSGVADVAFLGGRLYALMAAAGCSHGVAGTVNDVRLVHRDGSTTQVADLSAFLMSHPVARPNAGDFEPDGTWYSMVAAGGRLYAVEPNHGEVDVISPRGNVHRLIDVSASHGHIVPTSIAVGEDAFYLGNLGEFDPGANGHSSVFRLSRSGHLSLVASGLTAVTGVAVRHGQIYALEAFTGFFAPTPDVANTGTIVKLNRHGGWDTVATGLSFPTAMTFGPDGNLYVSNRGFGQQTNTAGEIVKVQLSHEDD
jgi:hypothetical protein